MQQHQALKLALGSILTPVSVYHFEDADRLALIMPHFPHFYCKKRPPTHTNSRHSPGTASPAFHGTYSGAHTPIGSPPSTGLVVGSGQGASLHYPAGHGPNSSEHLHLYNPYGYSPHGHIHSHNQGHGHGHGHGHVPSRLGPGRSVSSLVKFNPQFCPSLLCILIPIHSHVQTHLATHLLTRAIHHHHGTQMPSLLQSIRLISSL